MTERDLVSVGTFGRAHGIRGEIRLFAHHRQSPLLEPGVELIVPTPGGDERYVIEQIRWGDRFGIVALEDVDDRDIAEGLTNLEVYVDATQLPDLDDEIYQRDLVGLPVVVSDHDEPVGEVAGFFETGANDVMVVETSSEDNFFVPMAEVAVADIDLEGGRIVLHPFEQWAPEDFSLDR